MISRNVRVAAFALAGLFAVTDVAGQQFVYPAKGQSPEQQSRDRYECHRYAVEQTGYDPTQAGGGVSSDIASSKRSDYFRAEEACLDARGYSVK